ncbi:ribonuclease P [Candidatus Woesearchaeota archaeon CG_4_10_14_0_8_um_filter_47_5]|nr:MAG: ribonuclease P [Candidatus Woesearchaeota archaeon CG_4_10_14_0_8_um_filter_47_5]
MEKRHRIIQRKRANYKKLAKERIISLFSQAQRVFSEDEAYAHRYAQLAFRLVTKYNVPIPREFKRQFCKHCFSFLMPGATCRVRLTGRKLVYTCLSCNHHMRFPYVQEQKEKRKGLKRD